MQAYLKFIDGLPYILRVILALPGLDGIFYGIYRIAKGHLILGLIWIFLGLVILWIIDLYSMIVNKKLSYFI